MYEAKYNKGSADWTIGKFVDGYEYRNGKKVYLSRDSAYIQFVRCVDKIIDGVELDANILSEALGVAPIRVLQLMPKSNLWDFDDLNHMYENLETLRAMAPGSLMPTRLDVLMASIKEGRYTSKIM
jgi:hypothetical protein